MKMFRNFTVGLSNPQSVLPGYVEIDIVLLELVTGKKSPLPSAPAPATIADPTKLVNAVLECVARKKVSCEAMVDRLSKQTTMQKLQWQARIVCEFSVCMSEGI